MLSYLKFTVIVTAVLLFAGCSETQLVIHAAKKIARENTTSAQGVYKIGKPYKISSVWYYPSVNYQYQETGIASWYGPKFHGKKTANGERFDQNSISAAHRTLPLPSMVRVTNLENGRAIRVLVNDRGPFAHGRIIDLSKRAAQLLGFVGKGTTKVRVEIIAGESRRLALAYGRGAGQVQVARAGNGNHAPTDKPTIRSAPRVAVTRAPLSAADGRGSPSAMSQPVAATKSRPRAVSAKPRADGRIIQEPVGVTRMYVQAGTFTQYSNANRLRARLSVLGPTNILAVVYDKQQMFRVRIGPIGGLKRADRILERMIGSGFTDARLIVDR
jgi:rare lipoprotein A